MSRRLTGLLPQILLRLRQRPAATTTIATAAIAPSRPPINLHFRIRTMSSDAEYAAFLQKANKSYAPSGDNAQVQETLQTQEIPADEVHQAVKAVTDGSKVYVSDATEAFVTVQAEWSGKGLPSKDEIYKVLSIPKGRSVQVLDPQDWNIEGEHSDVVAAVAAAVDGGTVKVYKVQGEGARFEYFLLGVNGGKGRVEGVKVLSVES